MGKKEYFPSTSGKEPAIKPPKKNQPCRSREKDEVVLSGQSGVSRIPVFSKAYDCPAFRFSLE
jgi:hypothetical protein